MQEPKVTLDKVLQIATSLEAADLQAKAIESNAPGGNHASQVKNVAAVKQFKGHFKGAMIHTNVSTSANSGTWHTSKPNSNTHIAKPKAV